MKLAIPLLDLKQAIKAVKPGCALDVDYRPCLQYIKVTYSEGELSFFSCNGYLAYRYTTKIRFDNVDERLEGFIYPISIKCRKDSHETAFIDFSEDRLKTILTVPTNYAEVSYTFSNPKDYIKTDELVVCPENAVEQAYNPVFFKKIADAFDIYKTMSFAHSSAENKKPAYIVAKTDNTELEAIVLPMWRG